MRTHRFGRKIKLPATIAIKHQLRKLMFEDAVKTAEAGARARARAEATRGQLREETQPLVQWDRDVGRPALSRAMTQISLR
jgi:hypothetical protein